MVKAPRYSGPIASLRRRPTGIDKVPVALLGGAAFAALREFQRRRKESGYTLDGYERVHLSGAHRTIVLPNRILVDTKPPSITLARRNLAVVSPDGDARHDYLKVFFRTSERSIIDYYKAVAGAAGELCVKRLLDAPVMGKIELAPG